MSTRVNEYPFLPYPPIEAHGVVGDRRTAALVAADGTMDWVCVPDYDGEPLFASLLDPDKGGFWRFGPINPSLGSQSYLGDTAVLLTQWETGDGKLELCDAMLWPEEERLRAQPSVCMLRRLRCLSGSVSATLQLMPRLRFVGAPHAEPREDGLVSFRFSGLTFGVWNSFPVECGEGSLQATAELREGDQLWSLCGLNLAKAPPGGISRMEELLEETISYWRDWSRNLAAPGKEERQIRRSAITVQLLTYAPTGATVAAPSSSLPERIGGDWNADYRYSWVRDTSLSLALLAMLGKAGEVGRYLDWLCRRKSLFGTPLQVMYHVDGRPSEPPIEVPDVSGYRQSRPVRLGNGIYRETEHGAVGFLADCTLIYLESGGPWKPEYWHLIRRAANHAAEVWRRPDNGIWELPRQVHWVSSKVMCWVVLDRAVKIAEMTGAADEAERWIPIREEIRREVLEKGWSESAHSFRQEYESDEVDASLLLLPIMGFLPADDRRVAATVERIERELTVNGFVYRFRPEKTRALDTDLPMGVYEGAFFPTTFWLATTHAKAGRLERAEQILDRCRQLAGGTGIFSEGVDPATGAYLGNTPLLFSQVEYARARLAIEQQRSQTQTGLDIGRGKNETGS